MEWQDVCADPQLQNLPYKIEMNEWGKIIMSPVKVYHSFYQSRLSQLLSEYKRTGKSASECAIATSQGVKVADVVWFSQERFLRVRDEDTCAIAPEICIEILSDSNTLAEMQEKQRLYFEQGCQEFWTCDREGQIHFFKPYQELTFSELVPEFPTQVEL